MANRAVLTRVLQKQELSAESCGGLKIRVLYQSLLMAVWFFPLKQKVQGFKTV